MKFFSFIKSIYEQIKWFFSGIGNLIISKKDKSHDYKIKRSEDIDVYKNKNLSIDIDKSKNIRVYENEHNK